MIHKRQRALHWACTFRGRLWPCPNTDPHPFSQARAWGCTLRSRVWCVWAKDECSTWPTTPEWTNRIDAAGACGAEDTPRSEEHCVRCGEALATRRFIVSARWDEELFEPYTDMQAKSLSHPGLVETIDIIKMDNVLCSVSHWNNETLMVDEGLLSTASGW